MSDPDRAERDAQTWAPCLDCQAQHVDMEPRWQEGDTGPGVPPWSEFLHRIDFVDTGKRGPESPPCAVTTEVYFDGEPVGHRLPGRPAHVTADPEGAALVLLAVYAKDIEIIPLHVTPDGHERGRVRVLGRDVMTPPLEEIGLLGLRQRLADISDPLELVDLTVMVACATVGQLPEQGRDAS